MKKTSVVLSLTLVLVLLLTACAPAPETTSNPAITTTPTKTTTPSQTITPTSTAPAPTTITPKSGGVLKIVPQSIARVFGYPGDMVQGGSLESCFPCLEKLCGVDQKGFFTPTKLTTAVAIAADGKSITLTLRKDVKFHDGSDFKANVVKWNLDISKKTKIPGTDVWSSIDVVDDYTVRINLTKYDNTVIYQLANATGKIASQSSAEKNGLEWASTHPIGTGPFKFVSYTPDVGIKYERNDIWWGGKALLDGIEIVYMADDMAKSAALQSGAVDVLYSVTTETAIGLRGKGFNVAPGGVPSVQCMFPDSATVSDPLSNLKVRQAIEYAIDKEALKGLGNGFWQAAYEVCTPDTVGYLSNLEPRKYNPDKAKALLAEAGYSNGFTMKLIYGTSQTPPDAAVAIQQYLSKVGITVDVQQVSSTQRTDFFTNGWEGVITYNIFAGREYIPGLQRNLTPKNVFSVNVVRPPGLGDLMNEAQSGTDDATVEAATQKIVKLLYDDLTVIPLWVGYRLIYAQKTTVHDTNFYKTGGLYDWTPEKAWKE
jgi:ABC-type transport system substrate-binding protein